MARDPGRAIREAWIVDAVRTPVGRYGGALASVRPDDLAALALRAVVERTGIDPGLIDDVILGCANQAGEDNRNVARMAVLLAGLPVEVAGQTVNRLCGSGLQAINAAANAIAIGDGDVFIAGGVESMTRAPFVMAKAESALDRGATRPPGHDARLAVRQPQARGACTTPTRWARPPRTSPSATAIRATSRGSGRTRSRCCRTSGPSRRSRPGCSTTRSCRSPSRRRRATRSSSPATSTRAPTRRWRRSASSARPSARAAR